MFRADTMSKTPIQIQRKDSVIYHEGEKVLAEVVYRGQRHAEHKVKIVYSFGVSTRASVCADAMLAVRGVNSWQTHPFRRRNMKSVWICAAPPSSPLTAHTPRIWTTQFRWKRQPPATSWAYTSPTYPTMSARTPR